MNEAFNIGKMGQIYNIHKKCGVQNCRITDVYKSTSRDGINMILLNDLRSYFYYLEFKTFYLKNKNKKHMLMQRARKQIKREGIQRIKLKKYFNRESFYIYCMCVLQRTKQNIPFCPGKQYIILKCVQMKFILPSKSIK